MARAQGRRQMSAIIKFSDHIPSRSPITENLQEEFANINSPDTPLEQKLASALSCIMQLQMRISDMQEKMAQSQREVSMKETLLRNATQRELELRTQLVRRLW
jgi:FtsZ-binding cell division protein ZapB